MISMSMLAGYLEKHHPECFIPDDSMSIRGVRVLSEDQEMLSREFVYLAPAGYFVSDEKLKNAYIVSNQLCRLTFFNCDYDELFNDILGAFDFYRRWEEELLDAAIRQASLEELVHIGARAVKVPFFVANLEAEILAKANPENMPLDELWAEAFEKDLVPSSTLSHPQFTPDGRMVPDLTQYPQFIKNDIRGSLDVGMYLSIGGENVAAFCIHVRDRNLPVQYLHIASVLSGYLARAAEFVSPDALYKPSNLLLTGLLKGEDASEESIERAENRLPERPWQLLTFHHSYRNDLSGKRVLQRYIREVSAESMALEYDDDLLVITSVSACKKLPEELGRVYDLSYYKICLSMPFEHLKSVKESYLQARFAFEESKEETGIFSCEDFAFDYLLRMLGENPTSHHLLHPALAELTRYDEKHHAEFLRTLGVLLDNDENLVSTAEELNIHLNTLKYRIRRISELTGIDLKDKKERSYLRISFWLNARQDLSL